MAEGGRSGSACALRSVLAMKAAQALVIHLSGER
jgi:hypothetical protein